MGILRNKSKCMLHLIKRGIFFLLSSPSWHPTWASRIPAESTICTACLASWAGWLVSWPWLWVKKPGKEPFHSSQILHKNIHTIVLLLWSNCALQLHFYPPPFSSSVIPLPCKLPAWLRPSGSVWLEVLLQVGGGGKKCNIYDSYIWEHKNQGSHDLATTPDWSNNSFSSSRFNNEVAVLGTASRPELLRWLSLLGGKKIPFLINIISSFWLLSATSDRCSSAIFR